MAGNTKGKIMYFRLENNKESLDVKKLFEVQIGNKKTESTMTQSI